MLDSTLGLYVVLSMNNSIDVFAAKVANKKARIGIIGLGYVGLPLMLLCIRKGLQVAGFDTDPSKVKMLMQGKSYIKHINSDGIKNALQQKMFFATDNFEYAKKCDALLICVPTPLNANREPDMRFIESTAQSIKGPPPGQLIVLESTTYPGTTDTLLKKLLETEGCTAGKTFHLAFSPEREDPGNKKFNTQTIPKIIGGYTPECTRMAKTLYSALMDKVVAVSSTRAAEMTKLLENIFRSVNIALVNELKVLCHAMQIDPCEVIDAAATKPFGFMPFYPGPGLGGHCIPVDPFYLTWKAREYGLATRFIELAGEINTAMPDYVIGKVTEGLNNQLKSVNGSKVLVVGVAYKRDVDDMRESPALPIIKKLLNLGAVVRFHDPYIPKLWPMRRYNLSYRFSDLSFDPVSVALSSEMLVNFDAVVIVTDHTNVDYHCIAKHAPLIIDCRNTMGQIKEPKLFTRVVKA